jgi:hypothetical protein
MRIAARLALAGVARAGLSLASARTLKLDTVSSTAPAWMPPAAAKIKDVRSMLGVGRYG